MTVLLWYQFHIGNYNKLPRATLSASGLSNRCFWGTRGGENRKEGESEGTETPNPTPPPARPHLPLLFLSPLSSFQNSFPLTFNPLTPRSDWYVISL